MQIKKIHDPTYSEDHFHPECWFVCTLMLEIFKNHSASDAKLITEKILENNNFKLENGTVNFYYSGVFKKNYMRYFRHYDERDNNLNYFDNFKDKKIITNQTKYL